MAEQAKVRILFLCTGNSCRSQMAEGFSRTLKSGEIEAWSAGIIKHRVDPRAIKVMAEAGVDISGQRSKLISELPVQDFDWVITLCDHANAHCPVFPGKVKRLHRGFEDPPTLAMSADTEGEALSHYRRVRDEIRAFVESLPASLPSS